MKVLFWMFIGFDKHETSEHLLISIIDQLCKMGHSVHILQKHSGGELPSIPAELATYAITTDTIPFKAASKGNLVARYITELKYVNRCKRFIREEYDVVFIQSTTVGGFAVKTIRKKLPHALVTFNVQDIFPYNAAFSGKIKKNGLVFKVLAKIQRYAYSQVDHVITISEDMKNTLVEDGTEESKIDVIYNWSYQDHLYEDIDLSSVSHLFNPDMFNVVYAGNIGVMQNVDILVDAARAMKDDKHVWFHIIGNGVYKNTLEARSKEYGITNISFWPMQPSDMAPLIYKSADVNVIPLVKNVYKTALPSKTATCIACQKPIIFAIGKESQFGKQIMDETGCIVTDSDQVQELVDAIKRVKKKEVGISTQSYFLANMEKTKNSCKYVEIMTRRRESD